MGSRGAATAVHGFLVSTPLELTKWPQLCDGDSYIAVYEVPKD